MPIISDEYQLRVELANDQQVLRDLDRISMKAGSLFLPANMGASKFEASMRGADRASDVFSKGLDDTKQALGRFGDTKEEVERNLEAFAKAARAAGRETDELGGRTGKASGQFGKASVAMSKLLITFGTFQVVRFLVQDIANLGAAIGRLAENAARLEDTSRAFERLASRGQSAAQVMSDIERASGGVIGRMTLMQEATRAAVSDLPVERFHELVTVSRGLASVMGRDVTEALQRMTAGIAKQEVELFDEFGLVVRLNEVMREFADANNRTVESLSSSERQMIFFNAVLESGERKLRALGGVIDEAQAPFLRFRSALEDLGTEFGGFLNRTLHLDTFVGGLADSMKGLALAMSSDSRQAAESFSANVGVQLDVLDNLNKALELVTQKIPELQEKYKGLEEGTDEFRRAQAELQEEILGLSNLVPQYAINVSDLGQSFEGLAGSIEEANKRQKLFAASQIRGELFKQQDLIDEMATRLETLNTVQERVRSSTDTLRKGFESMGSLRVGRAAGLSRFETFLKTIDIDKKLIDDIESDFERIFNAAQTTADKGTTALTTFTEGGLITLSGGLNGLKATAISDLRDVVFRFDKLLELSGQLEAFNAVVKSGTEDISDLAIATDIPIEALQRFIDIRKALDKELARGPQEPKPKLFSDAAAEKEAREVLKRVNAFIEERKNLLIKAGKEGAELDNLLAKERLRNIGEELEKVAEANREKVKSSKTAKTAILKADTDVFETEKRLLEEQAKAIEDSARKSLAATRLAAKQSLDEEAEILKEGEKRWEELFSNRVKFASVSADEQMKISRNIAELSVAQQELAAVEAAKAAQVAAAEQARAEGDAGRERLAVAEALIQDLGGMQVQLNSRILNKQRQLNNELKRVDKDRAKDVEDALKEQEKGIKALATQLAASQQELGTVETLKAVQTAIADRAKAEGDAGKERLATAEELLQNLGNLEEQLKDRILTIHNELNEGLAGLERDRARAVEEGITEQEASLAAMAETQAKIADGISANIVRNALDTVKSVTGTEEEIFKARVDVLRSVLQIDTLNAKDRIKVAQQLSLILSEEENKRIKDSEKASERAERLVMAIEARIEGLDFTRPTETAIKSLNKFISQTEGKLPALGQEADIPTAALNRLKEAAEQLKTTFLQQELIELGGQYRELARDAIDARNELGMAPTDPDALLRAKNALTELQAEMAKVQEAQSRFREVFGELAIAHPAFEELGKQFQQLQTIFDVLSGSITGGMDEIGESAEDVGEKIQGVMDTVQLLADAFGEVASRFSETGEDISRVLDSVIQGVQSTLTSGPLGLISGVVGVATTVFDTIQRRQEDAQKEIEKGVRDQLRRFDQLASTIGSSIAEGIQEGIEIDYEQLIIEFAQAKVAERIADIVAKFSGEALGDLDVAIAGIAGAGEPFEEAVKEEAARLRPFLKHFANADEAARQLAERNVRQRAEGTLETSAQRLEDSLRGTEPIIKRLSEAVTKGIGSLEDSATELDDQIKKSTFRAVTEPQGNQIIAFLGSVKDNTFRTAMNTGAMAQMLATALSMPGALAAGQGEGQGQAQEVVIREEVKLDIVVNGEGNGPGAPLAPGLLNEQMIENDVLPVVGRQIARLVDARRAALAGG